MRMICQNDFSSRTYHQMFFYLLILASKTIATESVNKHIKDHQTPPEKWMPLQNIAKLSFSNNEATLREGNSDKKEDYYSMPPDTIGRKENGHFVSFSENSKTTSNNMRHSIADDFDRHSRHFTTMDACSDAMCDQVLRQAQGLSRIKLIRSYIKDTITMLDRLVTSVDAELISVSKGLSRALGGTCRAAFTILGELSTGPEIQKDTQDDVPIFPFK